MSKSISSAFFTALQQDGIQICELIELDTATKAYRWTTANDTIVSSLQDYRPFPGKTGGGIEESTDLGIATIDFVLSNSGGAFDDLLNSSELDMADVVIRRVLTNTPDLDSMEIYRGKLGDYSFDRNNVKGQARNIFNGIGIDWPYYTYMDQCVWRFGSTGCAFDTSSITVADDLESSTANKLSVTVASAQLTNSAYAENFFSRGRITFTSGANSGQIRTIRTQSGDVIDLSHQIPFDVSSGDTFSIFPGCRKRLVEDCASKYDNTSNFLGFPWIPRAENAF